jgi:hypothetical protein
MTGKAGAEGRLDETLDVSQFITSSACVFIEHGRATSQPPGAGLSVRATSVVMSLSSWPHRMIHSLGLPGPGTSTTFRPSKGEQLLRRPTTGPGLSECSPENAVHQTRSLA